MKILDVPGYLRDTGLRLLPHRAPTGLVRIGDPGPESPVLLTGNFTLTVRRLRQVLENTDAWLLVADSHGVNVWCAAGGGHLTQHDVISVIRTSGIDDRVSRREVILPQLAATGVERRAIEEATGWTTRWGPARLDDLPAVLARGGSVRGRERRMRFPLWERMEMAAVWALPMILIGAPVLGVLGGWQSVVAAIVLQALTVAAVFAALPGLPVTGRGRWLTYGGAAIVGAGIGAGVLALLAGATGFRLFLVIACAVVSMVVLSTDLAGTTPMYPGTINSAVAGVPGITLDSDRCTGAADCIRVCPCEVLRLAGKPPRATIVNGDACIACAACIVQCPEDALFFTYADGRVVEPATIRSTRLNLLGQRTVETSV